MTLSALACILTVLVGCYMFLYVTGKQEEVEAKDRKISRWNYDTAMARELRRTKDDVPIAEMAKRSWKPAAPAPKEDSANSN